jgi:hypothetical protein
MEDNKKLGQIFDKSKKYNEEQKGMSKTSHKIIIVEIKIYPTNLNIS